MLLFLVVVKFMGWDFQSVFMYFLFLSFDIIINLTTVELHLLSSRTQKPPEFFPTYLPTSDRAFNLLNLYKVNGKCVFGGKL